MARWAKKLAPWDDIRPGSARVFSITWSVSRRNPARFERSRLCATRFHRRRLCVEFYEHLWVDGRDGDRSDRRSRRQRDGRLVQVSGVALALRCRLLEIQRYPSLLMLYQPSQTRRS